MFFEMLKGVFVVRSFTCTICVRIVDILSTGSWRDSRQPSFSLLHSIKVEFRKKRFVVVNVFYRELAFLYPNCTF